MHVVVLTFPGHFFQTMLCLRSIRRCYANISSWQIILDDHAQGSWSDYVESWAACARNNMPWLPWTNIQLIKSSDIDVADPHYSGWWRQQMLKLHLDQVCQHSQWLVIDGDVIFDQPYIVNDRIPVSLTDRDPNLDATSCLTANYIKFMLNFEQGYLEHQGRYAMTNPIPFRYMHKTTLQGLRSYIQNLHGQTFVDLHRQLIQDKKIVAFQDPPQDMIMSEWELIEAYRFSIMGQQEFEVLGSGYPIMMHTSHLYNQPCVFRHGYCRDTELPEVWWQQQGIDTTGFWREAENWLADERASR